ncbi:DUF6049 family protein [Nocardioides jiangxiensis]|uniref:DUF6049 family protein n=1 Tax=Nocardioides jiangxiensis TaxID=3064524 RepID=A0ABT9B1K4_9ACTN|nr:DUF6049 family protein [Nocardioides sp. WY-20]MDO7868199.1 DUF6049 family protein [Nocardioides sp. WY-20]
MIRLLAALLAPLVVIAGLVLGLPTHQGEDLQRVIGAQADADGQAAAALGGAVTEATTAKHAAPRAASLRAAAGTDATPTALPLGVTMTGLSSAVVPKEKAVVVRGRVVNDSDETWTDINVYACSSGAPITSSHELDHAAEATTDDVVCGRTSVFTTIDSLAPGASAAYRLKVDRDRLGIGSQPGVYWFGVQALGTSTEGRDSVADGTVRTFLPQVGESAGPRPDAAFSLVLPIRARTLHTADGRLANPDTWATDLGTGGRLSNMLALAASAPAGEATLLVDPAVVDAVRELAAGNPARDLGTATVAPSDDASPAAADPDPQDDATAAVADDAAAWLRSFTDVARRLPVLALPYGDLDVAGASHHDVRALARARQESEAVFKDLDVAATPAIVPPNGLLPAEARELADGATVIVSSAALPDSLATADAVPSSVSIGGEQVLVAGSSLSLGGPGPTDGSRALALRQRLLAEGLLRSDEDATDPALVVLPYDADPGPRVAHFFDELDRSFLRLTGVSAPDGTAPELEDLAYPSGQLDREIPHSTFAEADRLTELGDTLDRILPRNAGLAATAAREALSATSYFARDTSLAAAELEGTATANLGGAVAWFDDRLASVDVSVPRFVILGSTEGPFAMTVTNDLTRPIRLGIRATTTGGLDIRAPRTINVPASSSRTVNLVARATGPGVHSVVLVVTDEDGHPIRKSQDISIRSRDVGWVIWLIMGGGAALLFGAIALRWRKRLRARAATPAVVPGRDPEDGTTTDTETPEAP